MRDFTKRWRWPILIGLAGWLAVAFTRADPGITCDEPFSVIFGIDFVSRLSDRGWQFFSQESVDEAFAVRSEHPPLGRWVIGVVHRLVSRSRDEYGIQDILDARLAPATAFALMLVIITRVVSGHFGEGGGIASGVSLLVMPHLFGHAHFAALDTFVSLTYLAALLSASWMMERRWPWLAAPLAGCFLGLVLLTKIHGIFVPAVVGLWAVACYRFRSTIPLIIWLLTGLVIFFAGWPWLWKDLQQLWSGLHDGVWVAGYFPRLSSFLASGVDRAPIYVPYFSGVFRDTEVPWYYPWVNFAVSVPVGVHILALCGIQHHVRCRRDDRAGWLYIAAIFLPLVAFSIPGVPVYDGVRLFLMVFPCWAVLAGLGAKVAFDWLSQRWGPRLATSALTIFLAGQSFGIFYYHPFELSYYNLLTGGLRGAARMGLEVTYWGDSVTTDLLDRWSASAPESSCALLLPTLYEGQVELYQSSSTVQKRQRVVDRPSANCPYVIFYNRRAYLDSMRDLLQDANEKPLFENVADGVWVARVYARRPSAVPRANPN